MGGIGSGRKRERCTVESCFGIDIGTFADAGGLEPGRRGTMEWGERPSPIVQFEVTDNCLETFGPRVSIPIVERETPSGGTYPLFQCPLCGNEVRNLYLRPKRFDDIGCRDDWNLSYRRNNASHSPRKMGGWRLNRLRSELSGLKEAAAAPGARHSPRRAERIDELEAELDREQKAQRGRVQDHVDKLLDQVEDRLGYDPIRLPQGPGLDKPLFEATDEEILAAAKPIREARGWPKP